MTKFDHCVNKGLNYVWLAIAVGALAAAFIAGAWHQLFVALVAILMYVVTKPKKWVHIPNEVYEDLNTSLSLLVNAATDGFEKKKIEAEMDNANVTMWVEFRTSSTTGKFTDGAWGQLQSFTETNWTCEVNILAVTVTDNDDHIISSDFDEEYIETEYDVTEWK